jgi:proteasome lid subunit RPN8/RPN11
VILDAAAAAVIRRHAAEAYPYECCGALIGQPRTVGRDAHATDAIPLPNTTADGPRRRFLVSPAEYVAAERRADERGAALLGFYHSHPDHPARPSAYDLEQALPVFFYVIVAVDRGAPGAPTVWRLGADRTAFEAEELTCPLPC